MKESRRRIWLLIVALAILLSLVGCTTEPIEDKAMASQAALPEIETESAAEEIPTTEETEPPILEGELFLKVSAITFSVVGESEDIYLGVIPRELVTWSSEDPDIVSVENGVLTAVNVGTTVIYASYADREVSCTAGCLAQDREKLEAMSPEILGAPKWLPPEVDLEEPCVYFDNAAIVGDSITYVMMQHENNSNALGDMTFLARGGVSVMGFVLRSKNMMFQGRELVLEEAIAQAQVERVYFLLGSNDVAADYDMDTMMGNWRILLTRIRDKSPKVEIALISSIPRHNMSGSYNRRTIEYNMNLRQLVKEYGGMYLDLHSYVQDHLGRLPDIYRFDDTHLNELGCTVWMKIMRYYARYESEGGILE